MIWIAFSVGLLAGALVGALGTDWWHRCQTPVVEVRDGIVKVKRRFLMGD